MQSNSKEYRKAWYEKNRKHRIAQIYEYQERRRLELTNLMLEVLAGEGCSDCPENDPMVLEFDHVRGEKTEDVSMMVRGCRPWTTIEKEIEKCEVVCANCHKRRTHQRNNSKRQQILNKPS